MNKGNTAGMTLIETLVGIGIGSLVILVLASVSLYSARSFSSLTEFSELNRTNRMALDQVSRDVRQSKGLKSFTNSANASVLVFKDAVGTFSLIYSNKTLKQTTSYNTNEKVLLTGCTSFTNHLFQGSPILGTTNFVKTTDPAEVKMVQLVWSCQRKVDYKQTNSDLQTMRIVIRKKI
jgi:Tfp pilus assembly protein PilW